LIIGAKHPTDRFLKNGSFKFFTIALYHKWSFLASKRSLFEVFFKLSKYMSGVSADANYKKSPHKKWLLLCVFVCARACVCACKHVWCVCVCVCVCVFLLQFLPITTVRRVKLQKKNHPQLLEETDAGALQEQFRPRLHGSTRP
jgi:hypothetical protein